MQNRKIVNRIEGEVLDTRMVMTVRLPEGTIVKINGNLPKGSTIDIWATDISRNGQLLGYEGYKVVQRTGKSKASVFETPWFKAFTKGLPTAAEAAANTLPLESVHTGEGVIHV